MKKDSCALEMLTSWEQEGEQEKRQQQQWDWAPEGRKHTEPRVSGGFLGRPHAHRQLKGESELPREFAPDREASVCKGLCQGERAWLTGIAERVSVWPGPEHSCKTSTQEPNSAENGKTILWALGYL